MKQAQVIKAKSKAKFTKMKFIISLVMFSLIVFGCDKKPRKLKAKQGAIKTSGAFSDPNGSAQSNQMNQMQGLSIDIYSLLTPQMDSSNENLLKILSDLDVSAPTKTEYPVTTVHTRSGSDSAGQADLGNGLSFKVYARCSGTDCDKYMMMASIEYQGQIRAQVVALSYALDCYFYKDIRSVGNSFKSLNEVEQFYSSKSAQNDCSEQYAESESGASPASTFDVF